MADEARCHCGAVKVEVGADLPDQAVVCNCRHCRAKELVLATVSGPTVTIKSFPKARGGMARRWR